MKHLETEGLNQREQELGSLRNREAWLDHREMGTAEGGEIREGDRVRQVPAHRRPLYFSLWAEKIL